MQNKTLKKLSLLGLVLMAASAVTAAILPALKKEKQQFYSISAGMTNEVNDNTTQSCAPTMDLVSGDIQCDKPTATAGLGSGSGSTSAGIFEGSSNVTTLGTLI